MAADLHIHAVDANERAQVEQYNLHTGWSSQIGNFIEYWKIEGVWLTFTEVLEKYPDIDAMPEAEATQQIIAIYDEKLILFGTPNIWVGEVSWLKASLVGGEEGKQTFIPGMVQKVWEIFLDAPIITDEIIQQVRKAFTLPNTTSYYINDSPDEVVSFLEKHKGMIGYTISW